jgi:diaminohydroxyphosphoribosylaminopyrimidine deaminase/5-amino-6-(5-phosphoribosylamino)uracil reductase
MENCNHPYITIKAGMSIDGKIATITHESKWITNSVARIEAHKLRNQHNAILVGVNTIITDNPSLTVRIPNQQTTNPIRIVLDTSLQTPITANVVTDLQSITWIFVGSLVPTKRINQYSNAGRVQIVQMDTPTLNLLNIVNKLHHLKINSLLVEGGSKIITSFITNNLFDQLILFISPIIIGGHDAPSIFSGSGFTQLAQAPKLKIKNMVQLEDNMQLILGK